MSSEELVTPEAIAPPPKAKKATGPRDPRMVRIGGYIAGAGFIPAILCAAILGAQPGGTNPVVEWLHRGALFVILAGFLVILYGVLRFDQIHERFDSFNQRYLGVTAKPVTNRPGAWIIGFVVWLVVATAVITLLAAVGLTLLALLGVMFLPAPMLLLAIYGPRKVRPFFVAALFPALVLLVMDCMLMLLFAFAGFERPQYGGPRVDDVVALHLVAVLLIPLFGFVGQHVIGWLQSQDEKSADN